VPIGGKAAQNDLMARNGDEDGHYCFAVAL
jgi:hypothetical protein